MKSFAEDGRRWIAAEERRVDLLRCSEETLNMAVQSEDTMTPWKEHCLKHLFWKETHSSLYWVNKVCQVLSKGLLFLHGFCFLGISLLDIPPDWRRVLFIMPAWAQLTLHPRRSRGCCRVLRESLAETWLVLMIFTIDATVIDAGGMALACAILSPWQIVFSTKLIQA